jgi:transposase
MLAVPLPVVSAPPPPAPPGPPPPGRFAPPPWGPDSADWRRIDAKLPKDHLARQIDEAVGLLDLTELFGAYAGVGSLAHRPDLLLKVALYEVQRGRPSPAQWAQDVLFDEPCQWLARGLRPSRSRLYAFRDRLGPLLDGLHDRLIGRAVAEGLTPARRASVDGSDVAANASRHRLLNEDGLARRQQALAEAVAADQRGQPPAGAPAWMAKTPTGRAAQQQRYDRAGQRLGARVRDNAARPASKRLRRQDVRVSPGDPEAALGLDKFKVFRPLYNVQLMPDLDSPLVLAWGVYAQATDAGTLPGLLGRAHDALGRHLEELLSDSAYATALDLAACAKAGVTLYAPCRGVAGGNGKQIPREAFTWLAQENAYRCPEGHRLEYLCAEYEGRKGEQRLRMLAYRCDPAHCTACPRQKECTRSPHRGRMVKRSEHEHLVEALRQRMQSDDAKALYRLRCRTAELGFADTKQHRGLRRVGGRGLARARTEVGLVVLAHNALAVLRLRDHKDDPDAAANHAESSA